MDQPQGLPTSEGQPEPTTPTPSTEASDPWAGAEEAFNADPSASDLDALLNPLTDEEKGAQGPDGATEQPGTTPAKPEEAKPDEPKPEGEGEEGDVPKSSDGKNLWDTTGLDAAAAQRIKDIQAWTTKKNQANANELKTWKDGYSGILHLVNEVATDPSKLGVTLRKYSKDLEQVGIFVNEEALRAGLTTPDKPAEPAKPDPKAEYKAFCDDLRETLPDADEGSFNAIAAVMWKQEQRHKAALNNLSQEILGTVKEGVAPLVSDRNRSQKRDAWQSGIDELSNEATDWGEYEAEVQEHLAKDPILSTLVLAYNRDPQASMQRGITPRRILEKAYKEVTSPKRVAAAKKKAQEELEAKLNSSGEKPGLHTPTIPKHGQSWNEIEKDLGFDPSAAF